MRISYKVEIQPTPTQRKSLLQHAGNARWAYNWGLRQHKKAYEEWVEAGKPKKWKGWRNAIDLHRELNKLKKLDTDQGGIPWMYEASKCAPQEALRDLDKAFKNFLSGRAKYPRYKSRKQCVGGFRLSSPSKVDRKTIQLPKVGRIRIKPGDHGYIPFDRYAQASVTEKAGRWFVSVLGPEVVEALPNGGPAVGLDLGVVRLATLSDGTVIDNPRALKGSQRKISRLQREVSRRKKGSCNRSKSRKKLAKAHYRVRNIRADALHKATTTIAKSHGMVVIEDLRVKNMTKGGGSRKRGLNRAILDASFGEFRRLLEYKGRRYGCSVVAVPARHTSQRCSRCGCVDPKSRSTQSSFACTRCDFEINADLNAAINILVAGSCPETQNACGELVRPVSLRVGGQGSVKQESAVA